ncbi:MAG: hypothetical protein ACXWZB_01145 [Gaiellaceae bacterium]
MTTSTPHGTATTDDIDADDRLVRDGGERAAFAGANDGLELVEAESGSSR